MKDEPQPVRRINARHEWTFVPALGIELHGRAWGQVVNRSSEPPLVLVAGLGVSSRYWVPLARHLAERFDVLSPDLPGFGRTPSVERPLYADPGVREQADQLLAWMDARGIRRCTLCGHSMGAQVAADVALRHPDRVAKLVMLAPTGDPRLVSVTGHLLRLAVASLFETPRLIGVVLGEYATTNPMRILRQAGRLVEDAIEQKLPHIQLPALIIRGAGDPLVSQPWVEAMAARLPNAHRLTIDRVGHAFHFTSPRLTAEAMERFLDGQLSHPVDPTAASEQAVLLQRDNPRQDPLAPPQPIPPVAHGIADYLVAAACIALPRRLRWSSGTTRLLTAQAALMATSSAMSDHPAAVTRRVPMVSHSAVDLLSGLALLGIAAAGLRREPKPARAFVAGVGLYQLLSAIFTAKPTGPVRLHPRPSSASAPDAPAGRAVSDAATGDDA